MEKRRPKAGTVVMIVLLLALTGVCVYLAPRTRDAYQEYRTESEATPTPTADNANMMAVTLDPNATPTPTMLILKLGTQGDEVKKLQERHRRSSLSRPSTASPETVWPEKKPGTCCILTGRRCSVPRPPPRKRPRCSPWAIGMTRSRRCRPG